MQAPRALLEPVARHLRGIFGKDRGLIHVALFEAYALAVFEVDSRYKQHGYWGREELIKS